MKTHLGFIEISRKTIVFLIMATAISLFVFCNPARNMFFNNDINKSINVIFLMFGAITIMAFFIDRKMDILNTLLAIAYGTGLTFVLASHGSFGQCVINTISMTMPFLIIGFRMTDEVFEELFGAFIKIINIYIFILILVGIVDYISNASIQIYLANHKYFDVNFGDLVILEHKWNIYRYYSIWGHPLDNAWYILLFYILNIFNNRYFKPMLNENLVIIASFAGLLLCGSRAALVIGLILFIFINNRQNKPLYLLIFSVVCTALYTTSLFQQNLLKRFMFSLNSGDFSEGRNEIFIRLFQGFANPPDLLNGGGLGYSRYYASSLISSVSNFEYPFMMFAYDLGVIWTVIIYLITLLIPTYIFLKNRTYFILFGFLSVFIYLNTSNGISSYTDRMGQLCFITMLLINMSYAIKKIMKKDDAVEEADNV